MASSGQPRVTVITRTHDRPSFLQRAIASLRLQTFADWEHVIVNDGGESNAVDAVVSACGHTATVIHHAVARGMEAASNAGLAAASGERLIMLDDDDTWTPTCLQRLVEERDAAGPRAQASVCQTTEIREQVVNDRFEATSREVWNGALRAVSLDVLTRRNQFTNNAFLVDTAVVRAIGGFDEELPVYGDWDFNLRFFSHHDAVVVAEPLANYHRRSVTLGSTANSFARDEAIADRSRAALVKKWLGGEQHRNPHIGVLLALAPTMDSQLAAAARIDKVLNALHGLRHKRPLALIERALFG